jgi:TonB family protein
MNTLILRQVVLVAALFTAQGRAFSQVVHFESPRYPDLARQARIEGTVKVRVNLNAAGTVVSMQVLGAPPLLMEEVERNASKWTFAPGKQESTEISYEFRLEKPDVTYIPEARVTVDLSVTRADEPTKVLVVSHAPEPIRDDVILRRKR